MRTEHVLNESREFSPAGPYVRTGSPDDEAALHDA
jgi:hypothetical protein